jgi:hypothetical protein
MNKGYKEQLVYDISRDIIMSLDESVEKGVICKEEGEEEGHRETFIRLYAEHLR